VFAVNGAKETLCRRRSVEQATDAELKLTLAASAFEFLNAI